MRWPSVVALSALAAGVSACDKIPFLGRKQAPADSVAQAAPAPASAVDTTRPAPSPAPPVREAPPPVALVDEPWIPVDTGMVTPGMTRDQVIAIWGIPVAERQTESRTYLYFRNGCEVSCGTFDVVFLENDQVVDAIVRGEGHTYAGTSSSPPERQGQMTPPTRIPDGSSDAGGVRP